MAFQELALLFALILPLSYTQNTYYVTTTANTTCPGEPCRTLSEYVEQVGQYFVSNTTFIFLPGEHILDNSVSIGDVSNLTLVGDSSSFPLVTSQIICSQPASVLLYQISELRIDGLVFSSCGDSLTGAAVTVSLVSESQISNCVFQYNTNMDNVGQGGGAIFAINSNLTLLENSFENNFASVGGGVSVVGSAVSFLRNVFANNIASSAGGGVYIENSVIEFSENDFKRNYARNNGGAVFVSPTGTSTVNVTQNSFLHHSGGGWVVYVDFASTGSFMDNVFANNSGSVVYGSSSQNSSIYYVSSSTTVSCPTELCHTLTEYVERADLYFTSDSTFVFLPGNHTLENGLLVRGITRLALIGDSSVSETTTAWITCTRAVSLAFVSIDEVLISGLAFISCGDYRNPALGLTSINNSEISNCLFENCSNVDAVGGNGGAVAVIMSSINLFGCSFERNFAINGGGFLASQSTVSAVGNVFIGNAVSGGGGAAALLASTVSFVQNTVVNNTAQFSGGVVVVDSVATFEENTFIGNSAPFTGGGVSTIGGNVTFLGRNMFVSNHVTELFGAGLAVRSGHVELRGDTRFTMNSAHIIGGAVIVFDSSAIFSGNLTIEDSNSLYGGGLMAAQSVLEFSGNTIFQRNNAIYGAGIYVTTTNVSFSGNTTFSNNSANFGGGLYAAISNLDFAGTGRFAGNSALNGGGLILTADSKFYFLPNTEIHFVGNTATQNGGAIKVEDTIPLAYCFDTSSTFSLTILGECFFQLRTGFPLISCSSDIAALNVQLYFEGNTAYDGGSDLYGGAVDSCRFDNIALCRNRSVEGVTEDCCLSSGDVFDEITHRESGTLSITSDPLRPCICNNAERNCAETTISDSVFPGGTLTVSVIGAGQRNGDVPAVIHPLLSEDIIRFNSLEYTQRTSRVCTNLQYTVFSSAVSGKENITLFTEGPCPAFGRSISILLDVLRCPPGFELSETTRACVCDGRLTEKYTTTCNIENKTILHPQNAQFWVSFDNTSKGLILHPYCPFDYCSSEEQYIDVGDSDKLCNYNRAGKLCGKCREGFSLVLGTTRCQRCSNGYLALLLMFAFAGIALVLLLFVLKLTVAAGTISGLIFYANVVQVNAARFLPNRGSNILTVNAWLNLDLGIETCFYDGMDAYAKVWLQFVFPAYVWGLVGLIILVSHFSPMVARRLGHNPIAVLATLFFLSYAKFLRTIIAALSITFLEYPSGVNVAVWRPDGNIQYLTGKHIPLFIAAMVSLIFVFLPYTLLLFLDQWLQVKSKWKVLSWIKTTRVRSFLDAYRAPYADEHRYWTGLLFLVRCILFLVSATVGDESANLLAISSAVTALLTLGFVVRGVYRSPYIGALEASFLFNLGILSAASYHVTVVGGNQFAVTSTSVGVAYATFIGIILYHAYQQVKTTALWGRITKKGLEYSVKMRSSAKHDFSKSVNDAAHEHSTSMETTFDSGSEPVSAVSTTWVDLREPLLDDN